MIKRILLIEDNDLNRDMLSRRLSKRGYEVLLALDGQHGVDEARSQLPDLILMDMSLPVMDGWTATRTIRGMKRTAQIPIIALTAHAMSDDRQKAFDAGCNEYSTKPLDFNKLIHKIETLLSETVKSLS